MSRDLNGHGLRRSAGAEPDTQDWRGQADSRRPSSERHHADTFMAHLL
jgi:hypothetical protein